MNLIIQIKDGNPFEHPIILSNFISAFPNVNIDELPPEFAWFERVPMPEVSWHQEIIGLSYKWVGNIVKDVWEVREFTTEEKFDKQNFVKSRFSEVFPNVKSWTFDEDRCGFVCPVAYPNDGLYFWDENTLEWVNMPNARDVFGEITDPNFQMPISGSDFKTF